MANKKTKNISLPKNRKKILILISILLVSLVGTFFLYRSQAATHVATIVAYHNFPGHLNSKYYRPVTIPVGKSTDKAVWIAKSTTAYNTGFSIKSGVKFSSGVSYRACFQFYNKNPNTILLTVSDGDYVRREVNRVTVNTQGSPSIQQRCMDFRLSNPSSELWFKHKPLAYNGIFYKVTVIKL